MRYLVTGATGFVGSRVVERLLAGGDEVLALARSASSAARVETAGATPLPGALDDIDVLTRAAAGCDGVVHTAFPNGDLRRFRRHAAVERTALESIGEVLRGSERRLVAAAGFAPVRCSRPLALESDPVRSARGITGRNVELTLQRLAARGTATTAVRLPCVHGPGDHFTLYQLVELARRQHASWMVGDGSNQLAAVHVDDAAEVFCRALTRPGVPPVVHAVGEQGVAHREVAEAIGSGVGVPVRSTSRWQAVARLGPYGAYLGSDRPASTAATREALDWTPRGPGILDDLTDGTYLG